MRTVLLLLALGFSSVLHAEKVFPRLALYNLQGEQSSFPNGKRALVFMGCCKEAYDSLSQWYKILHSKPLLARRLAITVVPIFHPCMSCAVCRAPLMAFLQNSLPKRLAGHVGVLFSNVEEAAALFRESKDNFTDLRLFLVDETGAIIWQAIGGPTIQNLSQLEMLAGH